MDRPQAPRRHWRYYETAAGARPVRAFLAGLPAAERLAVRAAMARVRRGGRHEARHLHGAIYEVRATWAGQSFRVLFAEEGRRGRVLLALEAFSKKTQRTPPRLIALAEARLADWRARGAARREGRPQ